MDEFQIRLAALDRAIQVALQVSTELFDLTTVINNAKKFEKFIAGKDKSEPTPTPTPAPIIVP